MNRSLAFRMATRIVGLYPRLRWDLDARLAPFLVQNFGFTGALRWLMTNAPNAEKLCEEIGDMRANLAFAIISLLNGCSYCLYAHGRAFELYYFDKYGKLFPLSQHELLSLIPLTDDGARERLEGALLDAGLEEEVMMFRRIYALKLEGAEARPDEKLLVSVMGMYDTLNYCAVESQVELDDAHDPVNKNAALKRRYAEARLEAGRKRVRPEDIAAIDATTQE